MKAVLPPACMSGSDGVCWIYGRQVPGLVGILSMDLK
jgi:hypothetical protein